jgi:hypothetical protein
MFFCRVKRLGGVVDIAREFKRDHGTVSHAVKKVKWRLNCDPKVRQLVDSLSNEVDLLIDENNNRLHKSGENGQGAGGASVELRRED